MCARRLTAVEAAKRALNELEERVSDPPPCRSERASERGREMAETRETSTEGMATERHGDIAT